MKQRIAQLLIGLAEFYDKTLSANQLEMFVEDLLCISPEALEYAVLTYRRDGANKFFPLPAQLVMIAHANDGRPGAEEAWALIPKNETDSVVWSNEMREAFAVASSLLEDGDAVAARMAFKQAYEKSVSDARKNKKPVTWQPSFGYDKAGRVQAVVHAMDKNRISIAHAVSMYPELPDAAPNNPQVIEYKLKTVLLHCDKDTKQAVREVIGKFTGVASK